MANNVIFASGTKQQYTGLGSKDANTLYFLTNGEIYKGEERIASGALKVSVLPDAADAANGILYILPTGEVSLFNGTDFDTVVYKTVATIEDQETDDTAIPNVGAVKAYVEEHAGSVTAGVTSVTAGDSSIIIAGETSTPTVAVKISVEGDNALSLKADGLFVNQGIAPEYTIAKATSATEGYATSYELQKNGSPVGVKIDIPKDFLIKDASVKTAGDSDPSGLPNGTKYIDFVVNVAGEEPVEDKHLYISLADIAPVYTAGNGVEISEYTVSAKVVAGNGLSVDGDGIKMAVATTDTAGAMSNTDKTKLDSLLTIKAVDGATITEVDGTLKVAKVPNALTAGDKTFDGSAAVEITAADLNVYTKEEVDEKVASGGMSWTEIGG